MIDVLDELAEQDLDAHTSIVFAYNVDLVFYDKLVRRRLSSAGARTQIVFCDATPYAAALDGIDRGSRIGRAYSVTPIRVEGAFHPKAYMLLGRRKGRLVIGSGNSSIGGLVRNAEVFGQFDYDEANGTGAHPAFRTIFELAKRHAQSGVPAIAEQLARAESRTPWLRAGDAPDDRIVHVSDQAAPLMDVLRTAIGNERLKRVIAVSASFDRKLDAVRELAQLGKGKHETFVVVHSERVNIDGAAVGRLPRNVRWVEFDDPRPSKKHQPGDSYAHAKLYILETDAHDHLFFGSANLSSPALLNGANVELLVQTPALKPGEWTDRLGLADSLTVAVGDKLLTRTWEQEKDPGAGLIHVAGVEWTPGRGWLVSVGERVARGAKLALGGRPQHPMQLVELDETAQGLYLGSAAHAVEGVRFAWIVDARDKPCSTTVAVTWPEVARIRLGGWFGPRVEDAILNMRHGDVLGPVLFEFLDSIPDVDVFAFRSRIGGAKAEPEEASDDQPRPTESFYTDETADADDGSRMGIGDRSDLDLLASLVQPITVQHRQDDEDADEEVDDDSSLAEEQERRALDAKNAASDGSERAASATIPSAARMRKAGRRFARRVTRASAALDELQSAVGKQGLAIPPGLLARQAWMAYIAGFVAGRGVETADEGEQIVVEPDVLAHYVVKCAGALGGDASGGLLRLIDLKDWKSRDGVTLTEGLRFLVAAAAWAVAWFEQSYRPTGWSADDAEIEAVGIHDAIPLLVLARLIAAADAIPAPDFEEARRKLTAWTEVPEGSVERAYARAKELAVWLARTERGSLSGTTAKAAKVGTAVRLQGIGVAIVLRVDGDKLWLSMLSQPRGRQVGKYLASHARAVEPPSVGRLLLAPVPHDLFVT